MPGQKKAVTEEKAQRVRTALASAVADGGGITVRGVARAAGVDHVFILRRDDLRSEIQAHERRSETPPRGMDREDVHRSQGNIALSDRERAFIDRARGTTPMAQYAREATLEKAAGDLGCSLEDLDEMDTARRPAPRRQNRERT